MYWIPLRNSYMASFPLGLPDKNITGLVDTVGFQQAPSLRGTMDIIFSCAAVLAIAVYITYNPSQPTGFDKILLARHWIDLIMNVVFTVLVPEATVAQSVEEFMAARECTQHFKHALKLSRWTTVHSYILELRGFTLTLPNGQSEVNCDRADLTSYIRSGMLRNEDLPAEEDLAEIIQADTLATSLAVFQIVWLLVQCLGRWLMHLPVSRLELMASCYAICVVLACIFRKDKPYRIDRHPWVIFCTGSAFGVTGRESIYPKEKIFDRYDVASTVTGLLLAALHFAAWNSVFPTTIEQELWRIASIIHASAVGIDGVARISYRWLPRELAKGLMHLPLISRLLLIGLAIASMRALPAGSYVQPTWTYFIPHFG